MICTACTGRKLSFSMLAVLWRMGHVLIRERSARTLHSNCNQFYAIDDGADYIDLLDFGGARSPGKYALRIPFGGAFRGGANCLGSFVADWCGASCCGANAFKM